MSTNSIESIRTRLQQFKGRYPEVSERSGLGYSWVSKFANGARGDKPMFDTITRLAAALAVMEADDIVPRSPRLNNHQTQDQDGAHVD